MPGAEGRLLRVDPRPCRPSPRSYGASGRSYPCCIGAYVRGWQDAFASVPSPKFVTYFVGPRRPWRRCASSKYSRYSCVGAPCQERRSLAEIGNELQGRNTSGELPLRRTPARIEVPNLTLTLSFCLWYVKSRFLSLFSWFG